MKKALAIPVLFVVVALAYMIRNHTDYGGALPPEFPSNIPIVDGEIISGRRTLFEDGQGYVVDIRTSLPYEEVVDFYADGFRQGGLRDAPGMGEEFAVGDARTEDQRIRLEIHSRDEQTYVTIAVHLGEWW